MQSSSLDHQTVHCLGTNGHPCDLESYESGHGFSRCARLRRAPYIAFIVIEVGGHSQPAVPGRYHDAMLFQRSRQGRRVTPCETCRDDRCVVVRDVSAAIRQGTRALRREFEHASLNPIRAEFQDHITEAPIA